MRFSMISFDGGLTKTLQRYYKNITMRLQKYYIFVTSEKYNNFVMDYCVKNIIFAAFKFESWPK